RDGTQATPGGCTYYSDRNGHGRTDLCTETCRWYRSRFEMGKRRGEAGRSQRWIILRMGCAGGEALEFLIEPSGSRICDGLGHGVADGDGGKLLCANAGGMFKPHDGGGGFGGSRVAGKEAGRRGAPEDLQVAAEGGGAHVFQIEMGFR